MISTTIAVASGSNPSTYGNNVSLTATVTPAMSGGPTMAGTVTFYAAGVALGRVAVTWFPFISEGMATLTVKSLPGGSNSLTCAFSGDGNYNQSTSPVLNQTVHKATPTVTLALQGQPPLGCSSQAGAADGRGRRLAVEASCRRQDRSASTRERRTLLGTAPVVPLQPDPR